MLSYGVRQSIYFVRLFGRQSFRESKTSKSRIELQDLTSRVFTQMLDFLYGGSEPLQITTSTESPLP